MTLGNLKRENFWANRDYGGERFLIVVPSYKEHSLLSLIQSIQNQDCDTPFGLIIQFNASQTDDNFIKEINSNAFEELIEWAKKHTFQPYLELRLEHEIPPKMAGVGMARKLGMDRATELMRQTTEKGVLVCLDADCTVSSNYVDVIDSFYGRNPMVSAANIYFEHQPLQEDIIQYELHLRYFKQALAHIHYPFAYHTVGSSMSVRSEVYVKSGGMNQRQAGEDFYFLQKLFTQFPFGEINDCTVFPSPRKSDRVPFGTGRAMHQYQAENGLKTYSFQSFLLISILFRKVNELQKVSDWDSIREIDFLHPAMESFLKERKWSRFHEKISSHSFKNVKDLRLAFFRWMNNFQMIKYLHWMRDHGMPDERVGVACNNLLKAKGEAAIKGHALQLDMFRKLDKLATS